MPSTGFRSSLQRFLQAQQTVQDWRDTREKTTDHSNTSHRLNKDEKKTDPLSTNNLYKNARHDHYQLRNALVYDADAVEGLCKQLESYMPHLKQKLEDKRRHLASDKTRTKRARKALRECERIEGEVRMTHKLAVRRAIRSLKRRLKRNQWKLRTASSLATFNRLVKKKWDLRFEIHECRESRKTLRDGVAPAQPTHGIVGDQSTPPGLVKISTAVGMKTHPIFTAIMNARSGGYRASVLAGHREDMGFDALHLTEEMAVSKELEMLGDLSMVLTGGTFADLSWWNSNNES